MSYITIGKEKPWIGKEDDLQMSVARFLDTYTGLLWCHVANERNTSRKRGGKLKRMGVKSGVPDILIFKSFDIDGIRYNGLAVELKSKKGSLKETQHNWLKALTVEGYFTIVCYSAVALTEFLKKYNLI